MGHNPIPAEYSLEQNYPNPFNQSTTIEYHLSEPGQVTLDVFNMVGQRVASIINSREPAGDHRIGFKAGNLFSGVYLYRLQVNNYVQSRKLILMKSHNSNSKLFVP